MKYDVSTGAHVYSQQLSIDNYTFDTISGLQCKHRGAHITLGRALHKKKSEADLTLLSSAVMFGCMGGSTVAYRVRTLSLHIMNVHVPTYINVWIYVVYSEYAYPQIPLLPLLSAEFITAH